MKVNLLVLLGILAMLFAGCVSVGENSSADLPWSAPASWENSSLGIKY